MRVGVEAMKFPGQSLLQKCWFCIFVEALVEKCPIRQRLRQRLPTKFSAPLNFATASRKVSHARPSRLCGVKPIQRGEGPARCRPERGAPAPRDTDAPEARKAGALRSD